MQVPTLSFLLAMTLGCCCFVQVQGTQLYAYFFDSADCTGQFSGGGGVVGSFCTNNGQFTWANDPNPGTVYDTVLSQCSSSGTISLCTGTCGNCLPAGDSFCVSYTTGGSEFYTCDDPTSAPSKSPITSKPSSSPTTSNPSSSPTTSTPTSQPTLSPTARTCRPLPSTTQAECESIKSFCSGFGVTMKWGGTGCAKMNKNKKIIRASDGGCQCKGYCGYTCMNACRQDPECNWKQGKCWNRGSGSKGKAISQCLP